MSESYTPGLLQPQLLTDKSRLQEIYDLRVQAWEASGQGDYINHLYFPHGWADQQDHEAVHWIIEDAGKIVASARLCILDDPKKLEEDFTNFHLPDLRPFAFYSRLVVDRAYRGRGFSRLMDQVRINYIRSHAIPFTLAWASTKQRQEALVQLHFKELGMISHQYGANPKIDTSPAYILYLPDLP
jgi:GNAT superfamily N-acetyltransferase